MDLGGAVVNEGSIGGKKFIVIFHPLSVGCFPLTELGEIFSSSSLGSKGHHFAFVLQGMSLLVGLSSVC